jgi:hypothetical protein
MRWSEAHREYVRQNWQDMDDTEIGEHVGRSRHAVSSWRRDNGLVHQPVSLDPEAYITEKWDAKAASDIGCALRLSATRVRQIAAMLGLPPKSLTSSPTYAPSKPKGITGEQITWAYAHQRDPESRMILAMSGRDMRT